MPSKEKISEGYFDYFSVLENRRKPSKPKLIF